MKQHPATKHGTLLRIGLILPLVLGALLAPSASSIPVRAQDSGGVKPVVVYSEAFAESVPASEVPPDLIKDGERRPGPPPAPSTANPARAEGIQAGEEAAPGDEYEFPMFPLPKGENAGIGSAFLKGLNPLFGEGVASEAPQVLNMPAPLLSFDGVSNQDNFNAFGFRVSPPDTDGDVGPNHYVQIVNLLVRVYDKAGNPLTAPFKLSSLFTPLGGQCAAPDAGDPIALYDPLADRWLLSQFAFTSISSPPYHECIAISKTGDPTGAYFLYDFVTQIGRASCRERV